MPLLEKLVTAIGAIAISRLHINGESPPGNVSVTAKTGRGVARNPNYDSPHHKHLFTNMADLRNYPRERLQIKFMGTNSFFISDGTTRLMVDPFFTRPNVGIPGLVHGNNHINPNSETVDWALRAAGITTRSRIESGDKTIDAILVTHTHYDHVLDIAIVWRMTGQPLIFGSPSLRRVLKWFENAFPREILGGLTRSFRNVNIHPAVMDPEHPATPKIELEGSDFKVAFARSSHLALPVTGVPFNGTTDKEVTIPAQVQDYTCGQMAALVISHPKYGRIFIQGSSGYWKGCMGQFTTDTLILSAGGRDLSIFKGNENEYAREMLKAKPKRIYFSHWDNYFIPLWKTYKWVEGSPPQTKRAFDARIPPSGPGKIETRFLRIFGDVYLRPIK